MPMIDDHRDKTRVQMPAKMFPHLKVLCLLFMGPALSFVTKQRNSFLSKFGGFFLQEKQDSGNIIQITLFDEFLVLLGPIISRFLACSNEEKINKNSKGCSLQTYLYVDDDNGDDYSDSDDAEDDDNDGGYDEGNSDDDGDDDSGAGDRDDDDGDYDKRGDGNDDENNSPYRSQLANR